MRKGGNMKIKLLKVLVLCLLACTMLFAVSCTVTIPPSSESEMESVFESESCSEEEAESESEIEEVGDSYIQFTTLTANGTFVYGKVANTQIDFSFISEIEVVGDADFIVSLDSYGTQTVITKTVPLNVGDNTFYVFETIDNKLSKTYVVTIRRRPIYTVSFNVNGGDYVASQQIEEDSFATEPTSTRVGYDLAWSYDFASPIIKDTAIDAVWTAHEDTKYKVEYYLQNTQDNAYTLDHEEELEGITDTTVEAEIKDFYHYTYSASKSEISGNVNGDGSLVLSVYYTYHVYEGSTCAICGSQKVYEIEGEYIYFGEYPQSIKEEGVTITSETNTKGYYKGSDGEWYAKVVANPWEGSYTFSNGSAVTSGTTYYFKVEPIKWRILESDGETAFIVCESIIANKRYDYDSNNYAESEIRAWLNNEFYATAFSELQQSIILTTEVDNSASSTASSSNQYACENTFDKVFLLSYKEAVNTNYFDSYVSRERITSDYSRATGVYMSTSTNYYGRGYWWLRSPYYDYSDFVFRVDHAGYVDYGYYVDYSNYGVVPALKIQL